MMKAIAAVLVSFLMSPSNVLAQATTDRARQATVVRPMAFGQSSGGLSGSIARETLKLAEHPESTNLQQASLQKSWAGRHPVALGALIGAAGGVIYGAVLMKDYYGEGAPPALVIPLTAGIGAGIGGGIGAIVSRVRR